jgi:hypothetical protein
LKSISTALAQRTGGWAASAFCAQLLPNFDAAKDTLSGVLSLLGQQACGNTLWFEAVAEQNVPRTASFSWTAA